MLREVTKLQSPWKPSVICLTGDVGWRGAISDYIQAKEWLDQLIECCGLDYSRLVVCPGNHDIIREQARSLGRPSTSKEADEVLEPPLAEQYLRSFSGYNKFCQELALPTFRLGKDESYLVGERTQGDLRFVTLNSAWFAKGDDDKGKLLLGLPHLKCLVANNQLPVEPWDSSDGSTPNTWAYLLFPSIQWALKGESSASSEAVFLRGLRLSFERVPRSEQTLATDVTHLIPGLEPLLRRAPREILGATILAGLSAAEPTVRAYCSLIQSFAEFSRS